MDNLGKILKKFETKAPLTEEELKSLPPDYKELYFYHYDYLDSEEFKAIKRAEEKRKALENPKMPPHIAKIARRVEIGAPLEPEEAELWDKVKFQYTVDGRSNYYRDKARLQLEHDDALMMINVYEKIRKKAKFEEEKKIFLTAQKKLSTWEKYTDFEYGAIKKYRARDFAKDKEVTFTEDEM